VKLPDWLAFSTIRSRLAAGLSLLVAGVVTSAATGGVAPAVGFGLVALINLFRLWRVRTPPRAPNPA